MDLNHDRPEEPGDVQEGSSMIAAIYARNSTEQNARYEEKPVRRELVERLGGAYKWRRGSPKSL